MRGFFNLRKVKVKKEHIVCLRAENLKKSKDGLIDYAVKNEDVIIAQREFLESTTDFRQIIPNVVLMANGKVFLYERTKAGSEKDLHTRKSVSVDGHLDLKDVVFDDNSVIDIHTSIRNSLEREMTGELKIKSKILSLEPIDKYLSSEESEVSKKNIGFTFIAQLDGEFVESNEPDIHPLGFFEPIDILLDQENTEYWTDLICEHLIVLEMENDLEVA